MRRRAGLRSCRTGLALASTVGAQAAVPTDTSAAKAVTLDGVLEHMAEFSSPI